MATPTTAWDDEFNGSSDSTPDPTKWRAITGSRDGWGVDQLQSYTSRATNVHLDGQGHLVITAQHETYPADDGGTVAYTSGRLETNGLFATKYGQIEASIELPAGKGLWPAFWMMGANHDAVGWPNCGEIDIMESLGSDPFTAYGSVHGPLTGSADGYGLTTPVHSAASLAGGFHVYGISWSPGKIVFTLDGTPYATVTPTSLGPGQQWIFDTQPFYLILNLGVGGDWPGTPDAGTHFPASMLVDWVRVFAGSS